MKRIIIELSDEQHANMIAHLQRGHKMNFDEEMESGFGINLSCTEIENWLEIDMYGVINVGDVNWKIE